MANNKRLISLELWEEFKNEVTKDLEQYDHYDTGYGDAIDRVDDWLFNQPEVVHGRWISASNKPGVSVGMKCSLCGARIKYSEHFNGNHNNCHKCGAKMDGERREGE